MIQPRSSVLAILAVVALPAGSTAQVPPDLDWRTIESEHFRVTFAPGLEPLARRAAAGAEVVYGRLAGELTEPPGGTIEILLADNVDFSNGFATIFPGNRITLYAKPPVGDLNLGYFNRWIDLVVTHELVHIFHFDQAGWLGWTLRHIFGRVPFGWPIFPAVRTPTWSTEGLATVYESRYGGAGRLYNSYQDMVIRMAVLEESFPEIDQAVGVGPTWPGGSTRYIFGSHFLAHIADRHGDDALADLVEETATTLIPPSLPFDRMADRVFDESFTDAWEEWLAALRTRYRALADSLRAAGLTRPEILTTTGRYAMYPRVSPNGRWVAFAASDGRSDASTMLLDVATGAVTTVQERDQPPGSFGPAAWMPRGERLMVAQIDFSDPYHLYQDLYLTELEGDEERLTSGARLSEPDVEPGGGRVVAVQTENGRNRLVVYDMAADRLRPLTEFREDRLWSYPRWAPDGGRIAAALWRDGAYYDVLVLDTTGAVVAELTHDRALDSSPAWSPDGRWLLFWSDRGGIPNLYAFDMRTLAARGPRMRKRTADAGQIAGDRSGAPEKDSAPGAGPLYRITNVLGGAFFPDVSPDGRWIYFSVYHADGFHIARIPFEPGSWRAAAPESAGKARAGATAREPEPAADTVAISDAESYSPVRSLLPRYWLPVVSLTDAGDFFGASTSGVDLVGRHAYGVSAAYDFRNDRFAGDLSYRYRGLGRPVLSLSASQDWDHIASPVVEGTRVELLERERRAAAAAIIPVRDWRWNAAFTVGGEWIRDDFVLDGPEEIVFTEDADTVDQWLGLFGRASYYSASIFPYSISREDGRFLALEIRRRWDTDPFVASDGTIIDKSYNEAVLDLRQYWDFPVFGFADHVLAARGSGLARWGERPPLSSIGGVPGGGLDIPFTNIPGDTGGLLSVRGYPDGVRAGTGAWAASVAYRFPVWLVERGFRQWPLFFDRISGSLFVDAGDVWCGDAARARFPGACGSGPVLVGAGAELRLDMNVLFGLDFRLRAGGGMPLTGGLDEPSFYVVTGHAF